MREFGKLDILVNYAAYQNMQQTVKELMDEQWDHAFKNVRFQ